MADNINVTEGSGKIIASDEVSEVNYQLVKLVDGLAGQVDPILATNTGRLDVTAFGLSAHDVADTIGNVPVKIAGKAYTFDGTVPQTAVAEADVCNLICNLQGVQYVETANPYFGYGFKDYTSAQTANEVVASVASFKFCITDIFISNGATAGFVVIHEESKNATTQALFKVYMAINSSVSIRLKNPIKTTTAAKDVVVTSDTVTTHSVTISGFYIP